MTPNSLNKRSFKAILEFRALGDSILQKHLTDGAKNAQYTSADTRNEVISICGSLILEKIGDGDEIKKMVCSLLFVTRAQILLIRNNYHFLFSM